MQILTTIQRSNAVKRVQDVSLRGPLHAPAPGMVSLAIGEPSFDTPLVIRDAMVRALASGATHYCDQLGLVPLREAIAKDESRSETGARAFSVDEILITHGGSAGLAAVILGVVNPGDTVAIEDPTYSLYADLVAFAGGVVTTFRHTPDGDLDRDSVHAAVRRAKLVIVCQPSNPTGSILSRSDWTFLEEATRERQSLIVSDEAYASLIYDGHEFTSILDVATLDGRGILCQTFSKKFAMTGWRVGYLVGPREVIAAASRVHRTFNGSLNTAVQYAAMAAITEAQSDAARMFTQYAERRSEMETALSSVAGLTARSPAGAFYFFCNYVDSRSSVELAHAASVAGVLVRPGREFGAAGEGHVRLSFAVPMEDIWEGIRRLSSVLETPANSLARE